MDHTKLKVKELEMKMEELEALLENVQDSVQQQLDHDDIRTTVNQVLDEKELVTSSDLEQRISQSQVQLIKWIVGTGISTISIIIALLQFLK